MNPHLALVPPLAGPHGQGEESLDGAGEQSIPINIAYINCHGQTKFPISKQLEIQSFICQNKVDILHLQECKIDQNSFQKCGFITSNFNVISNNTPSDSHFGTATLVRSDITVSDIHKDGQGRNIIFNAAGCTWGNLYLPSGSGGIPTGTASQNPRQLREEYSSTVIPQLLSRCLAQGAIGGDLNSVISAIDCTKNYDVKNSPSFRRLVNAFSLKDSYRTLFPTKRQYSRYFKNYYQSRS